MPRLHYKSAKPWLKIFASVLFWAALAGQILTAQTTTATAGSAPANPNKESKPEISAKQAEEIFHSLDEVLRYVSDDTQLPIEHAVKKKLANRDTVAQRMEKMLEDDKDAQRMQRSEVVLKKFGLLPRDFDLRGYLTPLMREQVAGFYNVKDQTVYMMDWIPADQQLPVMAHELTHALQDQSIDLDQWLEADAAKPQGAAREKKTVQAEEKETDADEEVKEDEEQTARQAVAEGQGMVVMIDYMLRSSNQSTLTAPFVVAAMRESMKEDKQDPMFAGAPLFLRESLAFPYEYGLDFVRELLLKGGKDMAYRGALKRPPENTREVMEPKTYLSGEKLDAMHFPAMSALLGKQYERYDVGSVGEFDVKVLLEQFSGEKVAEKLAPQWRGGAYYAARAKNADRAEKAAGSGAPAVQTTGKAEAAPASAVTTKSIALLYVSHWATDEAAQQFSQEYAATLLKRYRFAESLKDDSKRAAGPAQQWMTDEGRVLIEMQGHTVLVLESFDAESMTRIRNAVFAMEASKARTSMSATAPATSEKPH